MNRIYSIIVISEKCNLLSTVLRSEKPILIWGIRINKLRLQWTDNKVKSNLHLKFSFDNVFFYLLIDYLNYNLVLIIRKLKILLYTGH